MADDKFWVSNTITIIFAFEIIPQTITNLSNKAISSLRGLFRLPVRRGIRVIPRDVPGDQMTKSR